jgi:hypothetical protein
MTALGDLHCRISGAGGPRQLSLSSCTASLILTVSCTTELIAALAEQLSQPVITAIGASLWRGLQLQEGAGIRLRRGLHARDTSANDQSSRD